MPVDLLAPATLGQAAAALAAVAGFAQLFSP
jgi:hypothetical protein